MRGLTVVLDLQQKMLEICLFSCSGQRGVVVWLMTAINQAEFLNTIPRSKPYNMEMIPKDIVHTKRMVFEKVCFSQIQWHNMPLWAIKRANLVYYRHMMDVDRPNYSVAVSWHRRGQVASRLGEVWYDDSDDALMAKEGWIWEYWCSYPEKKSEFGWISNHWYWSNKELSFCVDEHWWMPDSSKSLTSWGCFPFVLILQFQISPILHQKTWDPKNQTATPYMLLSFRKLFWFHVVSIQNGS